MNAKTKAVLENANKETQHMAIHNDTSLTLEDKKAIAEKVRECTKLKSLAIVNCPSEDTKGFTDHLAPVIAEHPALHQVVYTNNGNNGCELYTRIVKGNKNIDVLNIQNTIIPDNNSYTKLLEAIAVNNQITNLTLPVDPYSRKSLNWSTDTCATWVSRCTNLLALNFSGAEPPWPLRKCYQRACRDNRVRAEGLYKKVLAKDFHTLDDVLTFTPLIPSVIAVGTEKTSRTEILGRLQELNDFLLKKYGSSIGIDFYTSGIEITPPRPVAGDFSLRHPNDRLERHSHTNRSLAGRWRATSCPSRG